MGRKIFSTVIGQDQVVRALEAALDHDRVSHAYLFAGPGGAGKEAAARAFAAALCCPEGGCGRCDSCRKALAGTHPDIETIAPTGAFITVGQVREIGRTLHLDPGEGRARVYIIGDAGAFNAESANAFLKTLEEPPPFVRFILLAADVEGLLPTIVSRCQLVRFRPVATGIIEEHLAAELGVSATMAETCARVSGGDLALARRLCTDEELGERRRRYLEMGRELAKGEGRPAALAAEITGFAEAAAAAVEDQGGEAPEGCGGAGAARDAHRSASAARRREVDLALVMIRSWLRDMMAMAAGAREAVVNRDYELELEQEALPSREGGYRRAAAATDAARLKLGYNVDLELMLMSLFHEIRESV